MLLLLGFSAYSTLFYLYFNLLGLLLITWLILQLFKKKYSKKTKRKVKKTGEAQSAKTKGTKTCFPIVTDTMQ